MTETSCQRLSDNARDLTAAVTSIKVVNRLIDSVECSRVKGDASALTYQIHTGLLIDISDLLSEVTETLESVCGSIGAHIEEVDA